MFLIRNRGYKFSVFFICIYIYIYHNIYCFVRTRFLMGLSYKQLISHVLVDISCSARIDRLSLIGDFEVLHPVKHRGHLIINGDSFIGRLTFSN